MFQVRRHRSIHEVDISDLEAALRSEDSGRVYETPREEIARLRKMELEPQHYDVDINKEVRPCSTGEGLTTPPQSGSGGRHQRDACEERAALGDGTSMRTWAWGGGRREWFLA